MTFVDRSIGTMFQIIILKLHDTPKLFRFHKIRTPIVAFCTCVSGLKFIICVQKPLFTFWLIWNYLWYEGVVTMGLLFIYSTYCLFLFTSLYLFQQVLLMKMVYKILYNSAWVYIKLKTIIKYNNIPILVCFYCAF